MDSEAWWAIAHRVTESQTELSNSTTSQAEAEKSTRAE